MSRIPYIKQQGNVKVLMVHEKPMVLIAGESHNSSSSSLIYMEKVWDQAEALGMNTLLLPVAWETVEPEEGTFDFSLVDGLIAQARERGKKLVFLWFGTWKNAEGMYTPAWVKTDLQRFKRGQIKKGMNKAPRPEMYNLPYTTMSYLCEETCKADAKSFAALMAHLRDTDGEENTVVAIQVENETGLLGAAREHSDYADELFAAEVPEDLSKYMRGHTDSMVPDIKEAVLSGADHGNWEQQFGAAAEELFSAYYIASYVEKVAAAGKKEYPLPMSVNCWLDKGEEPGSYPSGGPVSRVHEVWRCAAPSIDLLCPDIYVPNFYEICDEYTRNENPLFIPECATHSYAASRLVYCVGHYHAMCYAPFGFEDMGQAFTAVQSFLFGMDVTDPALKTPQDIDQYGTMAKTLCQLMPLLTDAYGTERLQAVCAENGASGVLAFPDFYVDAAFETPVFKSPTGVCMGLQTGNDSCILFLNGCCLGFRSSSNTNPNLDLISVEEGKIENGKWETIRRLNGDETAYLCFDKPTLLKIKVFIYN